MATTIKCNICGNEIEITEAIRSELEAKVLRETELKHKEEIELIKKEGELSLIKAKETADKLALEKVRKEFEIKIKNDEEEKSKLNEQVQKSQTEQGELLKQLREARDAEGKMKVEYQRKLLEEQDAIKADAKKEAEEELNLQIALKDKKLFDAQKQIKELERKIQQGSQQMQGEVQELILEDMIKQSFPFDEIKEVPKGINGADVIQIVRTQNGLVCGAIVWESKNTKAWSNGWVQKLIEDQRELKAEIAVLVSSVLPEGINGFGVLDKIWVSDLKSCLGLAMALRAQLIGIKTAREIDKGKSTKAEVVYNYLTSNDFKQRIEVLVEYIRNRNEDIHKEKMYYNKRWEKEEKELQKIMGSTAGIYGDLQGIIGQALPKVKSLEIE